MCRTFSKMFFWFGIQLFDSSLKKYGGFNHFIAGKIFRWKYCYVIIALRRQWRFEWIHEDDAYYYDGYHNSITINDTQIYLGFLFNIYAKIKTKMKNKRYIQSFNEHQENL